MKYISICSVGMSAILMLSFTTIRATAQAGDVVVHAATVDITHIAGTEPIDQIDMTAVFTDNEYAEGKSCETADAPVLHGVKLSVQTGMCSTKSWKSNMTIPSFHELSSTLASFEGPTNEGASADAVLHTLTRLPGYCSSYAVRVDAVNVNLAAEKRNPVAVTVTLPDGASGCLSINNARIDQ